MWQLKNISSNYLIRSHPEVNNVSCFWPIEYISVLQCQLCHQVLKNLQPALPTWHFSTLPPFCEEVQVPNREASTWKGTKGPGLQPQLSSRQLSQSCWQVSHLEPPFSIPIRSLSWILWRKHDFSTNSHLKSQLFLKYLGGWAKLHNNKETESKPKTGTAYTSYFEFFNINLGAA